MDCPSRACLFSYPTRFLQRNALPTAPSFLPQFLQLHSQGLSGLGTSPSKLAYWLEGLRQALGLLGSPFHCNMGQFLLALGVLLLGKLKGRGSERLGPGTASRRT